MHMHLILNSPGSCRRLLPLFAGVVALWVPQTALAQLPGVPVLQNAWANPGITAAVNLGTGGGGRAGALAAAWAPRSGRFQLSGGIGMRDAEPGGRGATFGARVAVPVWSFAGGAFGVAGFVGAGAAREPDAVVFGTRRGGTVTQVPVGAAVGYRRALGFVRGISVYGAPFYSYNRLAVGDSSTSGSAFRISAGADVGVTSRIGVTAGAEFGGAAKAGKPGPTGTVFGLGASFALGRRD